MSSMNFSDEGTPLDIVRDEELTSVTIRRKSLIILLVVIAVASISIFLLYKNISSVRFITTGSSNEGVALTDIPNNKVNQFIIDSELDTNEYPTKFFTAGKNNEWQFNFIQPVVQDLVERDGGLYIVGSFNNTSREIFLLGTLEEVTIESIYETNINDMFKARDTKYIYDNVTEGQRLGMVYMTEYPNASVRTKDYCKEYEYYCLYANLYDALDDKGILLNSPEDILTFEGSGIVPALQIYKNLILETND